MDINKCNACPECGCDEYEYENLLGDGFRLCAKCGQDWWTDIDYKKDNFCSDDLKGGE